MDRQDDSIKYVPDNFSERAKRAAKILLSQRDLLCSGFGTDEFVSKSSPNDYLTEIDVKVEQNLKQAFAEYDEILQGEELGYDPDISEPYWLCDPIDGTGSYVRQQPFCTSMIAYIVDGEVEISFIYDFLADKLYAAEKGKGAFCNNVKINVSQRRVDQLKGVVVGDYNDPNYIKALQYFQNKRMNTYAVFSAGNEFVELTTGRTDLKLCIPAGHMDWDRAAGLLLVREAGGVYKRLDGSDANFRDNTFIATNPLVYRQLIDDPKSLLFLGDK